MRSHSPWLADAERGPCYRFGLPGGPTGGRSAALDVAMHDDHGEPVLAEVRAQRFGDHDRAMVSTGAPDRDREVRLALPHVARHRDVEQGSESLHERPVVGLLVHVVADALIRAR